MNEAERIRELYRKYWQYMIDKDAEGHGGPISRRHDFHVFAGGSIMKLKRMDLNADPSASYTGLNTNRGPSSSLYGFASAKPRRPALLYGRRFVIYAVSR